MKELSILLFLDISGGELLLIVFVAFLVFGPDKLPEMARKAGRFMNQMKQTTGNIAREFKEETQNLQNTVDQVKSHVTEQTESVSRTFRSTKQMIEKSVETDIVTEKKASHSNELVINPERPKAENPLTNEDTSL